MSTIPPRQRATLARRIACGLPIAAAARGSNLPAEQVGELMWENEFRELIGAFAEILEMDAEARKARLLKLARLVIEEALAGGDFRAALLVEREYRRNRDPAATLATGFSRLVERERVKVLREREMAAAATVEPVPARPIPSPAPVPTPAPVLTASSASAAAAEAARKLRATLDPADRAMWRKAGQLRHEMLAEQVLHHGVVRKADLDRRLGPPRILHPADDLAPGLSDDEALATDLLAGEPFTKEPLPASPLPPEPQAPERTDKKEETEAEFAARATALFDATLRQARPELRAVLETFSQEQLWALIGEAGGWDPAGEGGAQPQAP